MPLFGEPGERVAYERYEHAEGGPALYLVHGFTASAASFAANLDALRKHFTVVTVELLGHGRSDAPPEPERYRPERAVARILGLMEALGDKRAVICGHSLGGAVAVRCALAAPERFSGLVIVNSASAAGTPAWAERAGAGMRELARRVRAEGTGFLKQTRLYPAHSRRLDAASRELLMRDFDRLTPEGLAGTAEGLIPFVNAFEALPGLRVPTLVVVGQRDRDVMEVMPAFLAQVPHGLVRVVGLPEAGHAANLEAPREFETALVAFAREIGILPAEGRPMGRAGGSSMLGVVGGVLVAAGLGLLFAALVVANLGQDGEGTFVAAEPERTATAGFTPVTAVAGTRTAVAIQGSVAATPTSTPGLAATATVAATQAPAAPPRATPLPTATPPPTVTPLPTPTPTPAGPYATIEGPRRVALGESATYYANYFNASAVPLRVMWVTPVGTFRDVHGVTIRFASEGCFGVTLEAIFAEVGTRTAVLNVATGEATCGE